MCTVACRFLIRGLVLAALAAAGSIHVSSAGTAGRVTAGPPPTVLLYRAVGCRARGGDLAYRRGPSRKVVALTFDDGPWNDTPRFAAMLAANDVPATFFMIGRQVTAGDQATLRTELRDGDALGDHTWSHVRLTGDVDVSAQIEQTVIAIRNLTGYTPCVFRPPYGELDSSVIATARSLGLATILWDVDPSDYLQPGVGVIEQRVLAQVQPGSIVLSHDGGGPRAQTLAAYPYIIATLRARGYTFETVPQLLGFATIYRTCTPGRCGGAGIPGPLPRGSIVEAR